MQWFLSKIYGLMNKNFMKVLGGLIVIVLFFGINVLIKMFSTIAGNFSVVKKKKMAKKKTKLSHKSYLTSSVTL